jgi:Protein of unknown function (DUF2793)
MAGTPRLSLPFLSVGQAQKEFTHNESLQTLDILVGGGLEEPPRPTPPSSPAVGAAFIVADGATGEWAGKANCIAAWTSGGWRFVPPVEGMTLYERTSGTWASFREGAWSIGTVPATALLINGQQVVGPRAAAIAAPSGGTVVDLEARAALNAILTTLRQHGLVEA